MDHFNAHMSRLRSASVPVPFEVLLNAYMGGSLQQPVTSAPSTGLRLTIPSPHPFVEISPSGINNNNPKSYPSSPNAVQSPRRRPIFPSTSASYPVLPVHAHNPGRIREATLYTKNPLAEKKTTSSRPNRPKLHLFASRKNNITDHVEHLPEPPVEWLIGSSGTPVPSTPSNESSSASSQIPSEDASEDESDYTDASGDSESPLPFERCGLAGGNGLGSDAACRDLSLGLKALLKVQA